MWLCESMHCCSAGKSDRFGILEFGPQTRNFHPGGWGGGVWGAEDGCTGGLEGGQNGLFFFFLWTRSHSSCLSPHSLTLTLKRQNKAVEEDERAREKQQRAKEAGREEECRGRARDTVKSGIQGHNRKKVFPEKLNCPVSMHVIYFLYKVCTWKVSRIKGCFSIF